VYKPNSAAACCRHGPGTSQKKGLRGSSGAAPLLDVLVTSMAIQTYALPCPLFILA
jgi:hypothetical protein